MISSYEYQRIICLLDQGRTALEGCLADVLTTEVTLASTSAANARKQPFQRSADSLASALNIELTAKRERGFFLSLQLHIQNHYGSVAEFITDFSVSVPQYIADLSETLGFSIPSGSIVEHCDTFE